MHLFKSLVLYMALLCGANAAFAADLSAVEGLREGDMKKLVIHDAPKPVGKTAFLSEDGGEMTLSELEGKWLVVNFWATWCAPCKEEMPELSALQEKFGGDDFEVVTIASSGQNPPPAIAAFFEEVEVSNLPGHREDRPALAREMGVMARPVTLIVSPEGQEVARLRGEADWFSDSAQSIVETLLSGDGG